MSMKCAETSNDVDKKKQGDTRSSKQTQFEK